jgi:hypothetical protein
MSCVVVIPTYKDFLALDETELISLKHNLKTLSGAIFVIVGPASINYHGYLELAKRSSIKIQISCFDDQHFLGRSGYNNLLTQSKFYKRFKGYTYIMVCQLDAYVFRDELQLWCEKGFDYIGAPWFEGWIGPSSNKIIGVGNGGFSLRNIKKSRSVLKRALQLKTIKQFCKRLDSASFSFFIFFVRLLNFYFRVKSFDHLYYLEESEITNEDVFWSRNMATIFKDYKVAPPELALQFSFETNPSFLYTRNGNRLPFGCHAWEKHEPEFWKQFIPFTKGN